MRVGFLTRGPADVGSSRVRAYQFVPALEASGVEVRAVAGPGRGSSRARVLRYATRALILARWADVVVLQKPFQPPALVRALRRLGARLVVDLDDALWAAPRRLAGTKAEARHEEVGRRLAAVAALSEVVVAGNAHLAGWVRQRAPGAEVVVLPPAVDVAGLPDGGGARRAADGPLVVGWIGSPGNLVDLDVVAEPLAPLLRDGRVTLRVVSSERPRLDGLPVDFRPWRPGGEWEAIRSFDVGIMPLHDDERSRGRCGYKAMQYMAAGVPVVASAVGCAGDVVDHLVTGILVHDGDEWRAAVERLAAAPELRASMGASGRRVVEERFSLDAAAPRLLAVLQRASAG